MFKTTGSQETLFVRRFSDKYLYDKYENGIQVGGRIEYIKLFSLIAIFILVIACINFMNLSTAKAFGRIKEVGIKKTLGADRGSLIFQYLGESALMTFLALLLAIGLVFVLLPQFNTITGKNLALHAGSRFVLALLGITLFTSVVSGSYPALYLSGFSPIAVLKGKFSTTPAELLVRRGLVVFQFIMSVVLIVSVLVVYKQLSFIQTKNLGYIRDNIIMFKKDGKLAKDYESFLTDVKKLPGVVNASNTWGNMTSGDNYTDDISWEGKSPGRSVQFADLQVNYDFIEMMSMHVKEGRTFSRNFGADSNNIILTEAAVDTMGLQNPVGKTVRLWGKDRQIIGIVGNFYFESMYEKLKPCFLILLPIANNMMVKIRPVNEKQTLDAIANLYHAYNPGLPFDFRFLDQDFQALYASEQRVAVISRYFAALAVIISCLGLFGLAAFTAQRKRKEISIRKVVGASVTNVVLILSRDFLTLVLIAILIAFPLAWWAMNRWLQDFAYRIQIGAGIFLIAGSLIILITLFAVSFQAIKAALINPVKALRSE
jgi:putative ABC transport system permease protein